MEASALAGRRVTPAMLFADVDFRRVWLSGALAGVTRWMDMLVAALVVFGMTRSALTVAMILFLRTSPMLLFGLFAGAIADRVNRRNMILACLLLLCGASAALALLAANGAVQLWHIGAVAFLGGVYWTTEHPGRRALIGEIAGPARLGPAMGVDSSTINLTRLVGPPLGGLVLQHLGFAGAAGLAAVFYGLAAYQMARLRYRRPAPAAAGAGTTFIGNLLEGFRYVLRDRRVLCVLLSTTALNLFAFPYTSMIVPIGKTELHAGPVAIGLLQAAEATGAFIFSLGLTFFGRAEWFMRVFIYGAVWFLLGVMGFSLSGSYPVALGMLFLGGFGFAGFATMQSTIILAQAPPDIRSRVLGTLTVCIGAGPLGVLGTGLMADRLGAAATVTSISLLGLLCMAGVIVAMPDLAGLGRRRKNL